MTLLLTHQPLSLAGIANKFYSLKRPLNLFGRLPKVRLYTHPDKTVKNISFAHLTCIYDRTGINREKSRQIIRV